LPEPETNWILEFK